MALLRLQQVQELGVERPVRHHHHIVVILCCCTDERYSPYVDLFYDVGPGSATGDRFTERIQINQHKVHRADFPMFHIGDVPGHIPSAQDASEYFGVQRFDASAQDGGITCYVFNSRGVCTQASDVFQGASGRYQLNAGLYQFMNHRGQSLFVVYRDEGFANWYVPQIVCHYLTQT